MCNKIVCVANAKTCSGAKVLQCDAKGLNQPVVQDCAATNQACKSGGCVAKVCAAGTKQCSGNTVQTCNADELGYTDGACASGEVCDGGACKKTVCVANAKTCSGFKAMLCDAKGNLFVAEASYRIRRIAPNGTVTTAAGSGSGGSTDGPASSATFLTPRGLVVDARGGLVIVDQGSRRVRYLSAAEIEVFVKK